MACWKSESKRSPGPVDIMLDTPGLRVKRRAEFEDFFVYDPPQPCKLISSGIRLRLSWFGDVKMLAMVWMTGLIVG